MKSVPFVCSFAVLIALTLFAQSNRDQPAIQSNGLPIARQRHPAVPPNLSQTPQGTPLAQRRAGAFKTFAQWHAALPMQGELNFAPAVTYDSGGNNADSVVGADVNGDGKPDLLVANNRSNTVGVLLGNGDGTFQAVVTYGSGGRGATSVAVADVNGDGKPDLLVANECPIKGDCEEGVGMGVVGVLLGNGDGTFQTPITYHSGGFSANSVAVADVNGDGKPDLLVANDSGVGVLLGNGDGTFQAAVTYDSGPYTANSVVVADVNGDGKPDLLVASACGINCTSGGVNVLLGNGDGTFQAAVTYDSGGYDAESVAAVDVNGDGKPDLLVANESSNTVGVLLGNGDGTFQTAVTYGSGGDYPYSVAVADVDGDGKPDLLVANNCPSANCSYDGSVGVLLGNGDGTFQTAVAYDSGGVQATSVAVGDMNGDGKPDLLVVNSCISGNNCANSLAGVLINTSIGPTTTTLASSPNPSSFGQAVTFTATVTSLGFKVEPTGTVSFFDGTTNIGNSNLNGSGVATLTTSALPVDTNSMTATYNGDVNFASSTSPVLYQVVQGAIVVFSPTSLNFGNQTVGVTSTPQVVTLQNMGNINLNITSIQITGANSGDFAQTNNCPGSVQPNGSCQISVTFTPKATGTRNAAVSVADNAPGSPQSVPLTGVGVAPAVTFSPTSLTFPNQLVFTTSPAHPVTLTNTGAGVLTINGISITGAFEQTNDCPSSLNPGDECTINVKFHPKTKGILDGSVNVTDNAPGSPQQVPLTGTGTYVQLSPTKLNFGIQPVGTRSVAKRITLTNQGHASLNITSIAITGADSGDFADTNNCGAKLESGSSCFIKVTFKPLVKGKRTADVSISDDGGGSPQQAGLIGTGT